MRTIILTITTIALIVAVFADKPAFGGYKKIKNPSEDHYLAKAIKAAKARIEDISIIAAMNPESLNYITAYQKVVNGVYYKVIHGLSHGDGDEIALLETVVYISSDAKRIETEEPIFHTATESYNDDLIEEFNEKMEELFDEEDQGIPRVVKVSTFEGIAKETFYVVYSRISYEERSGKVVRGNISVFSKRGDKFAVEEVLRNLYE
jgi:hypothetical protein